MKFLLLFGDGAVGKMTVGQELTKITDFKLFHNHMSIEPVIEIFDGYNKQVVSDFRRSVFENFAKTDKFGLIFTYIWAFDHPADWEYVEYVSNIFKKNGGECFYVELVADQKTRLERNKTENRLSHKPSKRNVEISDNRIIDDDNNHRLVSFDGEIPYQNYIKIDNTHLSPDEVAKIIKEKFNF